VSRFEANHSTDRRLQVAMDLQDTLQLLAESQQDLVLSWQLIPTSTRKLALAMPTCVNYKGATTSPTNQTSASNRVGRNW